MSSFILCCSIESWLNSHSVFAASLTVSVPIQPLIGPGIGKRISKTIGTEATQAHFWNAEFEFQQNFPIETPHFKMSLYGFRNWGIGGVIITEMYKCTTLVQIYYSLCQTLLAVRAVHCMEAIIKSYKHCSCRRFSTSRINKPFLSFPTNY